MDNVDEKLVARLVAVKRALFDKLYARLNDKQREAVFCVRGPLLVLAGAGSGKTTVLVNRIAHIIRYGNAYNYNGAPAEITEEYIEKLERLSAEYQSSGDSSADDSSDEVCSQDQDMLEEIASALDELAHQPCPPWAVLSITFTNKAANEMKERLTQALGERADDIWAGTFHSICMRLLRKYGDRVGYLPGFTIYDTDDSKKVITACLKHLDIDEKILPQKTVMNRISRAKDKLMTPDDFEKDAGDDFREGQIAAVYREYQKRLTENNVLDFDDIIMKTVELLKNDDEVRDYCQRRFKYVCVDEYQDTNHSQSVLTRLLSGHFNNLMVVGDDDQSIYKFRGATIENILNFEDDLENVKVIKLEQNYRSTQCILCAANSLIRNNYGRRGKELWTSNCEGEKISLRKLDNQVEESKYIINKIMELVIREKRKYSDFAVLYRVNAQSNNLEQIFAKSGVPYRILGGTRFYERKEIKDILAYLCVVNNTADNLRLRRIINEPKRKIGEATVSAVEQLAEHEGVSMFEILEHPEKYTAISKSAGRLRDFAAMIKGLQEINEIEPLAVLIEKTIDMSGYRRMLLDEGEAAADRLDNVQELLSSAVEYSNNTDQPSLGGFLEEVALVADVDNYDTEADAVVLMTIHSSKGLEFPVVFLPGFEDGIFPSIQSAMSQVELEEERRLAYVALTRAKERLFATHVRERLIYGRTQYNQPSGFIEEIAEEYIDIEKPKKEKAPARSAKAQKNPISKEFYRKSDLASGVGKSTGGDRFETGDSVLHITFGRGDVLSVREMGADLLYEIAFDDVGTKKLMATYAKLKKDEQE